MIISDVFILYSNICLFSPGKQKVADLPGVGYALNQKLKSLMVITCTDLQRVSMSVLRREFGQKTGEMLFKYCRGKDDRQLKIERERKSVSAEINYAIRFVQVRP
jgi:DNA repair protein REV1